MVDRLNTRFLHPLLLQFDGHIPFSLQSKKIHDASLSRSYVNQNRNSHKGCQSSCKNVGVLVVLVHIQPDLEGDIEYL